MKSTTVTVEKMDALFLKWNSHINASGLFRAAIREEMAERDIDEHAFRRQVERAIEDGHDIDELATELNSYDDFQRLLEEIEPNP